MCGLLADARSRRTRGRRPASAQRHRAPTRCRRRAGSGAGAGSRSCRGARRSGACAWCARRRSRARSRPRRSTIRKRELDGSPGGAVRRASSSVRPLSLTARPRTGCGGHRRAIAPMPCSAVGLAGGRTSTAAAGERGAGEDEREHGGEAGESAGGVHAVTCGVAVVARVLAAAQQHRAGHAAASRRARRHQHAESSTRPAHSRPMTANVGSEHRRRHLARWRASRGRGSASRRPSGRSSSSPCRGTSPRVASPAPSSCRCAAQPAGKPEDGHAERTSRRPSRRSGGRSASWSGSVSTEILWAGRKIRGGGIGKRKDSYPQGVCKRNVQAARRKRSR